MKRITKSLMRMIAAITALVVGSALYDVVESPKEETAIANDDSLPVRVNPFAKPVDGTDYIHVDFEGTDGSGKAMVHIPSKYHKVDISVNRVANLNNGEKISIRILNPETYSDLYKFTKTTSTITVEGLRKEK